MKSIKALAFFILLILVLGNSKSTADYKKAKVINIPAFNEILNNSKVKGSIIIFDYQEKTYYTNYIKWAEIGRLPASTFKIPNSIIALETGVVEDDSTEFKWDGKKRRIKSWEKDLVFRDAFHLSCVPCYQEIARKVGVERMQDYLAKFNYGKMIVNNKTIDNFWLEGNSKISQIEQIDFLARFYYSELPISKRTEMIMKNLMVIEDNDVYKLSGKTGWAVRNGNNNGWFIGWIEAPGKVYFFATNLEPQKEFDMEMFTMIRKDITIKALKEMKIIK